MASSGMSRAEACTHSYVIHINEHVYNALQYADEYMAYPDFDHIMDKVLV